MSGEGREEGDRPKGDELSTARLYQMPKIEDIHLNNLAKVEVFHVDFE